MTQPKTRAEGRERILETDPTTGREYVTAKTRTGRSVDKNRSDGWRGYKSHLTAKQRRIIRWYLRQRDRGCSRERCWIEIQRSGAWVPSPMQYPLTFGTLASWELTRSAMQSRGKEWP
jgi:hypothetical protein